MKINFGVVVFPGSNCDHDAYHSVKKLLGHNANFLWHKEPNLHNSDVIILPGGFSYGDYLRAGAIAKLSPIMNSVIEFANKGGLVIGICNGFQILTESGLLPGALLRNDKLKFICKDVYLNTVNTETIFTKSLATRPIIKIPIAHGEGNYFGTKEDIENLYKNNQVVFKYCNSDGNIDDDANPNGSIDNIAGIVNKEGNVLGMMPHPERACESMLNRTDGILIFESIIKSFIKY